MPTPDYSANDPEQGDVRPIRMLVRDEHVVARVQEAGDNATHELFRILREMFGTVAMRNLSAHDYERIRGVLDQHVEDAIRPVEGYYTIAAFNAAEASTWNMLRGVLAGTIVTQRAMGQEPDPSILAFVSDVAPEEGRQ